MGLSLIVQGESVSSFVDPNMTLTAALALDKAKEETGTGNNTQEHDEAATGNKGSIYFGYGSNLWKHQMKMRCPASKYLGIARLNGYRWHINNRHYANIEEIDDSEDTKTHCFGLVYSLTQSDEDALDINEGVPWAYTKEDLETDFWPLGKGTEPIDIKQPPEKAKMLVYINRDRTADSTPKSEYVYRMNQGITDAEAAGVPKSYVKETLRKFIPAGHDEMAERLAKQQAASFVDEA